jgi:hypothetical protein
MRTSGWCNKILSNIRHILDQKERERGQANIFEPLGGNNFHSLPGKGAASWQAAAMNISREEKTKKISVICGFFFFTHARAFSSGQ